jgi:multiple sugar transport system permease protein
MPRGATSSSRRTPRALASSDKPIAIESGDRGSDSARLRERVTRRARTSLDVWRSDEAARWVFIWPTVLIILFLSLFPLVASLTLSVSRLAFQPGRVDIKFVGLTNYLSLLVGTEKAHFLGLLRPPTPLGWALLAAGVALTAWALVRSARSGQVRRLGLFLRLAGGLLVIGFLWLLAQTLFGQGGRPGSLIVTFMFVFAGIALQYAIGLGLALLAVQHIPGRRFFRIVFLLPLTITPVGVGYLFTMMTDTSKGPIEPLWVALGLRNYSWYNDPLTARAAIIIGDAWQWAPFVFIVLLAALEARDQEVAEAALVDGASRWQSFLHLTLPDILPVSTTIILIRLIEGFKIIDLPNILTGGGPGTSTESLTLQAYFDWRSLNLGRSAAIAYLLLIVVTIVATMYVSFVRRRVTATA